MEEKKVIPYLEREHLAVPGYLENAVYNNLEVDYYWTNDWSPEFYVELAYAGFISICMDHDEAGPLLTPGLHPAFAVLDWGNLYLSRKVKKLIKSGRLAREGFYLTVNNTHIDPVISGITAAFGETNWLSPYYGNLLHNLIESSALPRNFTLHSIELQHGRADKLIAGELGYSIGKTYTSLTGYLDRTDKAYNNMGTVQILCLAQILEQLGYAFWNLGQPSLQYKIDLGARAVERPLFLKRWIEARDEKLKFSLANVEAQKFYCDTLLSNLAGQ